MQRADATLSDVRRPAKECAATLYFSLLDRCEETNEDVSSTAYVVSIDTDAHLPCYPASLHLLPPSHCFSTCPRYSPHCPSLLMPRPWHPCHSAINCLTCCAVPKLPCVDVAVTPCLDAPSKAMRRRKGCDSAAKRDQASARCRRHM